jgi:hypothetical protein
MEEELVQLLAAVLVVLLVPDPVALVALVVLAVGEVLLAMRALVVLVALPLHLVVVATEVVADIVQEILEQAPVGEAVLDYLV